MNNHERIFGPVDPLDRTPGRTRKCKMCGGWHKLDAWPHNCLPERPRRSPLSSPQVPRMWEPFKPQALGDEVITTRHERNEYMKRNGLAEWSAGDNRQPEWIAEREHQIDMIADIKRSFELDKANIEPVDRVGETDLAGANEIKTEDIQIFGKEGLK